MERRIEYLTAKVTPSEKAKVKREAKAAGMEVSEYVRERVFASQNHDLAKEVKKLHDRLGRIVPKENEVGG